MDASDDILREAGFRQIGVLSHRIRISIWWDDTHKIQALLIPMGSKHLLRTCKSYYLKSITEEGETWAREIAPLQDYLESHFPEMHLAFSHFRDIVSTLAARQIHRKIAVETPSVHFPTVEEFANLQKALDDRERHLQSSENLLRMANTQVGDLLSGHERRYADNLRHEVGALQSDLDRAMEKRTLFQRLQQDYVRKGAAACLRFSISSNIHLTATLAEFRDALMGAVKELTDAHRYQVTQKLGGKLNIRVQEEDEPGLIWIEEWSGGSLSPRQMERIKPDFETLRHATYERLMVTAKEDIQLDGHVRESRKRMAAHVASSLVRRLDREEAVTSSLAELTKDSLPARMGRVMQGDRTAERYLELPLALLINVYISGSTGSGKSYTARAMVEEAARYEDLGILIIDPRNQAVGLRAPEDRESHLSLYSDFGMKPGDARGFPFNYFAPNATGLPALPKDLRELAHGRNIVSLKELDDLGRSRHFHQILDAVFESLAREEASRLRLMIFVEEAHRFTKRRVDDAAKKEGARAEVALDRTVREIRKYGGCVVIVSQTIRDFAYESASIRQNTNTKVFMHNSDREIEYAATYLENGKELAQFAPGTAMVYNAAWGAVKVKVRPPLSKVWEYSLEATRALVGQTPQETATSPGALALLEAIRKALAQGNGLNATQAGALAGISSKRALHDYLDELERVGLIRTKKLRERGRPRVIEIVSPDCVDTTPDANPERPDGNGGPNP